MDTLPSPAWADVAPTAQIAHAATASVPLVIPLMLFPFPLDCPLFTVGRDGRIRDTSDEGSPERSITAGAGLSMEIAPRRGSPAAVCKPEMLVREGVRAGGAAVRYLRRRPRGP